MPQKWIAEWFGLRSAADVRQRIRWFDGIEGKQLEKEPVERKRRQTNF